MSEQAVVEQPGSRNPLLQVLPPKYRDLKKVSADITNWVARQPLPIEAAIATVTGSFQVASDSHFLPLRDTPLPVRF